MMTVEFITALFSEVDEHLHTIPKHPEAHLGPVTCPQRRGQPALLSLVDARLSAVVSPPPRAHPPLSPLEDPSRLDAGLLGRPNGAWGDRHVWDGADSPDPRRPESPTDRPQGALEPPLDCRRETLSPAQSMGVDRRVGVCHGQCR